MGADRAAAAGDRRRRGQNIRKTGNIKTNPLKIRIDHPHQIDLDVHESPACGARFRPDSMVFPERRTGFAGTKEDEDEFTEEMVMWEDE